MTRLQRTEFLAQVSPHFGGALRKIQPLHFLDRRDCRRQGERVGFVGMSVREEVVAEIGSNLARGRAQPERNGGVGDALGRGQDVWNHVPVIHSEPLAGATPAAHDLIRDQQNLMVIAYFSQTRHVLFWRHQHAVGPHHGLDNHRCHVALVLNHVLDVLRTRDIATRVSVANWTFVAIHFGRKNDARDLARGLHRPPSRIAGRRHRSHGRTVVGAIAGNDLGLAAHHAGNLEGGFVRLSAGSGKEEFLEARGQDFEQTLTEFRSDLGGETRTDKGQLPGLLRNRVDYSPVLMTEGHAHQLRGEIKVPLTLGVNKVAIFRINDRKWRPALLATPCTVGVAAGEVGDL